METAPEIVEGEASILPTLELKQVIFMQQADSVGQIIILKGDPRLR